MRGIQPTTRRFLSLQDQSVLTTIKGSIEIHYYFSQPMFCIAFYVNQ